MYEALVLGVVLVNVEGWVEGWRYVFSWLKAKELLFSKLFENIVRLSDCCAPIYPKASFSDKDERNK